MKTPSMVLAFAALGAALAFGVSARFVRAADANDPLLSPDALAKASGEEIYRHVCQGCHMPDGRGAQGAGTYPALAGNAHLASAQFTAATVALGRHDMPHFAPEPGLGEFEAFVTLHLDDRQIAAVVNYVRSHFGNHYTDEVTAADIAALHR
jgi:mono/diheme cytochrome c family protein